MFRLSPSDSLTEIIWSVFRFFIYFCRDISSCKMIVSIFSPSFLTYSCVPCPSPLRPVYYALDSDLFGLGNPKSISSPNLVARCRSLSFNVLRLSRHHLFTQISMLHIHYLVVSPHLVIALSKTRALAHDMGNDLIHAIAHTSKQRHLLIS